MNKRPILDAYAKAGIFSEKSLQKWRSSFDDDEIICYVLMEYFKKSAEDVYKDDGLISFSVKEIESIHDRLRNVCGEYKFPTPAKKERQYEPLYKHRESTIIETEMQTKPKVIEEESQKPIDFSTITIEECVSMKCCSSIFIDILRENYNDDEILAFILAEYLDCPENIIKERFPKLSLSHLKEVRDTINRFVNGGSSSKNRENREARSKGYKSESVNAFYNGPRFPKIPPEFSDDPEEAKDDLTPDWGYLNDIPNS